jgi:hypothetical protein
VFMPPDLTQGSRPGGRSCSESSNGTPVHGACRMRWAEVTSTRLQPRPQGKRYPREFHVLMSRRNPPDGACFCDRSQVDS